MKKTPIYQVDPFTHKPFSGIPAVTIFSGELADHTASR